MEPRDVQNVSDVGAREAAIEQGGARQRAAARPILRGGLLRLRCCCSLGLCIPGLHFQPTTHCFNDCFFRSASIMAHGRNDASSKKFTDTLSCLCSARTH